MEKSKRCTVVPGFRVLGFSALPGFRAQKASDGAWLVHKTLFGFRAPLFWPFLIKICLSFQQNAEFFDIFA